jgi:hypothetical protein
MQSTLDSLPPLTTAEAEHYKRIVDCTCDPLNGASAEANAAMRAHMEKTGADRAFIHFLKLRKVDPDRIKQPPPTQKLDAALRKHFPEMF